MYNSTRLLGNKERLKIVRENIGKIKFDPEEFKTSGYTDTLDFCSNQILKIIGGSIKDYLKTSSIEMNGVIFKPTPISELNKSLEHLCRIIKFEGELYTSPMFINCVDSLDDLKKSHTFMFQDVKKTLDKPFVVSGVYILIKLEGKRIWFGELPISFVEYQLINEYSGEYIKNIPATTPEFPYIPVAFA